jgi:dihydrolipoamide dehydrogenase
VVEAIERVLPSYDAELTQPVLDALKKRHRAAPGLQRAGLGRQHGVHVRSEAAENSPARRPRAGGRGPQAAHRRLWARIAAADMAGRHVAIDAHCRTSMRNVWAIGDVTGEPMLAHRAMAQGEWWPNRRQEPPLRAHGHPAVCFTDPEVVVAGRPRPRPGAGIDCIEAHFPSPPTAAP